MEMVLRIHILYINIDPSFTIHNLFIHIQFIHIQLIQYNTTIYYNTIDTIQQQYYNAIGTIQQYLWWGNGMCMYEGNWRCVSCQPGS
jgi:hypothetical protein